MIVLPWDLTSALCYGGGDYEGYLEEEDPPREQEFKANFRVLGNRYLADPNESWYQGVNFITVIERLEDRELFGYAYWENISKHGEAYVEENTDEYKLNEGEVAWIAVEPFTVIGFKEKEEA